MTVPHPVLGRSYMDNSEEQGDAEAAYVAGAEWTLWDYDDVNGLIHEARVVPSAG